MHDHPLTRHALALAAFVAVACVANIAYWRAQRASVDAAVIRAYAVAQAAAAARATCEPVDVDLVVCQAPAIDQIDAAADELLEAWGR